MEKVNIADLISRIRESGYDELFGEARLCQDIILMLITKSRYVDNVTIKGGVVLRSITNNIRRSTLDLDLDFIKHSINDEAVRVFIGELNGKMGLKIEIVGSIECLRHQDYEGKRAYVRISDMFGNTLQTKIDFGVHKYIDIIQEEYCFNISFDSEGANLFVNSKEQILTEKLKSLLRFGELSTRYKDLYDICYLAKKIDKEKLLKCFRTLIFGDSNMKQKSVSNVVERLGRIFKSKTFMDGLSKANKNWTDYSDDEVINVIMDLLNSIK